MAIPKVYKWNDANAPVLSGLHGAFANVLKKCLVEGYGDKAPAGWTLEDANVDETIISLRNSPVNGTGFFLQVRNAQPLAGMSSNICPALCTGYEEMSSCLEGQLPFGARTVYVSRLQGGHGLKWAVVATDTFFHFFCHFYQGTASVPNSTFSTSNNCAGSMYCFGDFHPINEEGYNCVSAGGQVEFDWVGSAHTGTAYGLCRTPAHNAGVGGLARGLSGAPGAVDAGYLDGGPYHNYQANVNRYRRAGGVYAGGSLLVHNVQIIETPTYGMRGVFPGLFVPCHNDQSFASMVYETITKGGRTFLIFPFSAGQNATVNAFTFGHYMVEIGADW